MNRFVIRFGSYPWYFNGHETGKINFVNCAGTAISWERKSDAELMMHMLNGQFTTSEFIVVAVQ